MKMAYFVVISSFLVLIAFALLLMWLLLRPVYYTRKVEKLMDAIKTGDQKNIQKILERYGRVVEPSLSPKKNIVNH